MDVSVNTFDRYEPLGNNQLEMYTFAPVSKLFKSVGGKLIGWYLTFGHYDPDDKAAASAVLAAAAGGSLSDVETTQQVRA